METFCKLFGSLLALVYHCFDRIVIQGYLPLLTRPEHHDYCYIRDEVLGFMVMCVGSFLPFQTIYYLNGHHYIAGELQRRSVRFRKDDNLFVGLRCGSPTGCRRPPQSRNYPPGLLDTGAGPEVFEKRPGRHPPAPRVLAEPSRILPEFLCSDGISRSTRFSRALASWLGSV